MNKTEPTHIQFDGEKIVISPNLTIIFNFLMNIEKEVKSFINFEQQLQEIRNSYHEMLGFTAFLVKKIKENNIDISYNVSEHPDKIVDKFKFDLPIRSQFIVLFANLETLFCLYVGYNEKTDNEKSIRAKTRDEKETKKFIDEFILSEDNEYYKNNVKIFSNISATQLRFFRNSLTHFFSVSGNINIIHNNSREKALRLEKRFKEEGINNIVFISPNDLFGLIGGAFRLALKTWSNDYLNNPDEFKERILFVQSIVDNYSAVLINDKDLNI